MNHNREKKQVKQARLEIVSAMYKKGYTVRKIVNEVEQRMGRKFSTRTIWNDINDLMSEWREERLNNVDDYVQLELARIDDACIELWEQWERSKQDYTQVSGKRIGMPKPGRGNDDIVTIRREQQEKKVISLGDPAYISEIRQQLAERRKLLGLYAAEKKEILGNASSPLIVQNMTEEEIRNEIDRIRSARSEQ